MDGKFFSVILIIIRWALGILLLFAGIMKLLDVESFVLALDSLNGIPQISIPFIAALLPPIEIVVALYLFWNVIGGAIGALLLNVCFLIIIGYNYLTGFTGIDCGCFGDLITSEVSLSAIVRQVLLSGLSVYLVYSIYSARKKNTQNP